MSGLITKTVKIIDNVATGRKCREARKKSGLSLRSVAGKMGFSVPYVSDLEKGQRAWTPEKLSLFERSIAKPKRNSEAK